MAILINTTLTKSGLTIPTGSIIKPNTHFVKDELGIDVNGAWDGTKIRRVTMDLVLYASKADFQALKEPIGRVNEFEGGFERVLSDSDWSDLSEDNALLTVETWLKDYLDVVLGATCSIIDPYVV